MNPTMAVSNPSMAMTRKQRNSNRFCSHDTGRVSMKACTSTTPGVMSVVAIALDGVGHLAQETS